MRGMKRLTLLGLLTLGCWREKTVPFDFGDGTIQLPEKFRQQHRATEREPDSIRHYFRRVYDTHLNGQTSYAEELVISRLAPTLAEQEFRQLLARGHFDAMTSQQGYETRMSDGWEWQFGERLYEQHPVKEPALVVRLIDWPRRAVLTWYGYRKHFDQTQAQAHLRTIYQSLVWLDADWAARFRQYEQWKGNGWMDAYFENLPQLTAALEKLGLKVPYQEYIGSVSNWERNGRWAAAIDGERPGHLHLVDLEATGTCSAREEISPDLRAGFAALGVAGCIRVHRLNLWEKQPDIAGWFRRLT